MSYPVFLGFDTKAKQTCGAAGSRQEPSRQWDGAEEGGLGAGSVGGEEPGL